MSTVRQQKNQGNWMIAVERVEYVLWYPEDGAILREIRETRKPKKMSRRRLANNLIEKGVECTHSNIKKIEDGQTKTAPIKLLEAICNELGYELHELLPMIFVGSTATTTSFKESKPSNNNNQS
jgi:DNA-binding Xre family transcriptional regulator